MVERCPQPKPASNTKDAVRHAEGFRADHADRWPAVRVIGVTSAKRSPELPDVAAIAETVPGYDASLWSGLLAPRGTPAAVIERLHRDTAKLLQLKDIQDAFERVGTYVVSTNPQAFREYIALEYAKWRDVMRAVNLQIN